jgi:type II secretion system protein G
MFRTTNRGFTLIELLVVIAIIGMLSSVVLASLNDARKKARDAQRQSDLKQLALAMELYLDDNGTYPCEQSAQCPGQSIGANGKIGEGSGLDTLLEPYLSAIPTDPLGPGNDSYYYYYDARHSCGGYPAPGGRVAVIFARNVESSITPNPELCSSWGGEGGGGQPGAFHIILGRSPDG